MSARALAGVRSRVRAR